MTTLAKRFALIKRKAWNLLLDLRYGGVLGGTVQTRYAGKGATNTENTPYDVLAAIFRPGTIHSSDVLVDVGCGKGRVINWWLSRGYRNKIIGIELDPDIGDQTRRRLRRYSTVSIIGGDALENIPADGTLYYLYNPFAASVLQVFCDRLAEVLDNSKDVRIYYYRPLHIAVFKNDPRWEVVDYRPVHSLWPELKIAVIRPSRYPRASSRTQLE
jgi:SAM-dependent methyltransferase